MEGRGGNEEARTRWTEVRGSPEGRKSIERSPTGPRRSGVGRKKSDRVRKVERQGDRSLKRRTERATREAQDEGEVRRVGIEVKRSGGMGK